MGSLVFLDPGIDRRQDEAGLLLPLRVGLRRSLLTLCQDCFSQLPQRVELKS